jgi:hypothetical protein
MATAKTSKRNVESTNENPVSAPTAAPDPDDVFLTTEETARRLRRSPKVLEYWRLVGQGPPFYRQGRVVRYLLSEVVAWGTRCRVTGRDTAG